MVSELEKYAGPFEGLSFIRFINCGHCGTRCSHTEIEFGKNCMRIKKLYPTLPGWPTSPYGKFSSYLGRIPAKSSQTSHRWVTHFLSENTIF